MDERDQEKKDRLLAALDRGMVMVHLDARRPGVSVPEGLREEAHLRLNLSYRFDPPDLSVGEWGVRSTLSFKGQKFVVAIPWSALFALASHVSGEFWMFPDDMPQELIQSALQQQEQVDKASPRKVKGSLRSIDGEKPSAASEPEAPAQAADARSEESPPQLAQAPSVPAPAVPNREAVHDAAAVQAPEPTPQVAGAEGGDEPPKPKGRGHLRLVK